jgi:hypothetical protein
VTDVTFARICAPQAHALQDQVILMNANIWSVQNTASDYGDDEPKKRL